MTVALQGVRVLDLSRLLPGPFATQLLADFGADVVKVEEPGHGDYLRGFAPLVEGESAFFLNLNRNKRSLAVDLKNPAARGVFLDLVRGADVLIESFRPGVMGRLGFGYEELRTHNPRLVYCALTGYGARGPWAGRAGHDVNYLALSGALALNRDERGRPVVPGFQVADLGGGAVTACVGILLALLARERTGRGQFVDAAMVDGLAPWIVYRWSYRMAGSAPETYLSGEYPCYAVYEAADGRFLALGALEPKFWSRLCRHLGREDWVERQFASGEARETIFAELSGLFRSRPRDAWVAELEPVDCCVTPVLELEELENHPHWRARRLVREVIHPVCGVLRCLAPPVTLSDTPASLRRAPPALGEHTDEVLRELGYPPDRIRDLKTAGALG
ncbi:MAG: CaiB/BaiF CoA-transferase family protein [Deferrisomatales bacterium]